MALAVVWGLGVHRGKAYMAVTNSLQELPRRLLSALNLEHFSPGSMWVGFLESSTYDKECFVDF